eukprot:6455413-Amphidinium_carterae.4
MADAWLTSGEAEQEMEVDLPVDAATRCDLCGKTPAQDMLMPVLILSLPQVSISVSQYGCWQQECSASSPHARLESKGFLC